MIQLVSTPVLIALLAAAPPGDKPATPKTPAAKPGTPAATPPATTPPARPAAPAKPKPKPWQVGVSAANKAKAQGFFKAGNYYFGKSEYARAAEEYRKAIGVWDHPSIRYNMTVCLINLDQPVQAYRSLLKALRYGRGPLSKDNYREAKTYLKLLLGRLAHIEVVADQPGVEVSFDGKPLIAGLAGPRRVTQIVMPGRHSLVARKAKYITMTRNLILIPGRKTVIKINLVLMRTAIKYKRRWANWIPWTVLGSGAAIGAIGVGLYFAAKNDFDLYDKRFGESDECRNGCLASDIPGGIKSIKTRAKAMYTASLVMIPLGGIALAAGVTMVILNLPKAVEERPKNVPVGIGKVRLTPSILPGGAYLGAAISF